MSAAGVVALMGALQGAILAAALWGRRKRRPENRWLAVLVALLALRLVNHLLYRDPILGHAPVPPRFTVPLLFVFAPLLFLYLRTLVVPRPTTRRDVLHFLPGLAVLGYCTPFYHAALRTPAPAWTSYGQSLRWESTALNALLVLQTAFYLLRIRQLLPGYDRRAREVASNLEAARFRWTRWLAWALLAQLALVAGLVVLQILGVGGAILARRDLLLVTMTALTIYGSGYMALAQPSLFAEEPEGGPGRKYEKSALTPARADEGAGRIRALMESQRLYLDEDLTLATLSAKVGMPAAQVSQIINERLGQNFYDLVNGYRVAEARKRLVDPSTRQQKVLAIGLEVGFRSKAAFNRVFKLRTGETPSEFRARSTFPAA